MPKIGYHVSSSGGYYKAVDRAVDYKLETFQLFLGSPRTWSYRDLEENEAKKFKRAVQTNDYDTTVVHMSYLPNPSTPEDDPELRQKTVHAFNTEVKRADLLDIDFLVFHIGSHKGRGFETAKTMVAKTINQALSLNPEVTLCLETSAGQTNAVGSTFEEIAAIFDEIDDTSKVGICFDTCHVFAAGYDLRTQEAVDNTFEKFDDIIGLNKLKVVHANDSKGKIGEGKDRHEHIGSGHIGEEGFSAIINHSVIANKPVILETPSKGVKDDIDTLKRLRDN